MSFKSLSILGAALFAVSLSATAWADGGGDGGGLQEIPNNPPGHEVKPIRFARAHTKIFRTFYKTDGNGLIHFQTETLCEVTLDQVPVLDFRNEDGALFWQQATLATCDSKLLDGTPITLKAYGSITYPKYKPSNADLKTFEADLTWVLRNASNLRGELALRQLAGMKTSSDIPGQIDAGGGSGTIMIRPDGPSGWSGNGVSTEDLNLKSIFMDVSEMKVANADGGSCKPADSGTYEGYKAQVKFEDVSAGQ